MLQHPDAETPADLASNPVVHLLFAVRPLLRFLRGDRREDLRCAWVACAQHLTSGISTMAEGRTPTDPREAALQVFDASLQLARTCGHTGPDLVARFNHQVESGAMNSTTLSEDAIEHMIAALMVLVARKLQTAA